MLKLIANVKAKVCGIRIHTTYAYDTFLVWLGLFLHSGIKFIQTIWGERSLFGQFY